MNRRQILNQIHRLEAELAELDRFGEDVFPDQTVLIFGCKFPQTVTVYTYVALKASGRWYVTGTGTSSMIKSWNDLVVWWKDHLATEIREVTETKEVLAVGS
jgi:hypothetical protein